MAKQKTGLKILKRDESANRCRECAWFDPAYDLCYFYGTVRVDDMACVEFQPED